MIAAQLDHWMVIPAGDKAVQTDQAAHMVYLHAGDNPFDTVTAAVKAVEKHLQTFHHRDKKKLPSFLDWFGWCTWDAFYTDVTADGVKHGLQRYARSVRSCVSVTPPCQRAVLTRQLSSAFAACPRAARRRGSSSSTTAGSRSPPRTSPTPTSPSRRARSTCIARIAFL
jgi:hypothetical protein